MQTLVLALLLATAQTLGIDTSTFLPGQTRVFHFDEGVTVTVSRMADVRQVRVERMGIANNYRLEPADGELRVTWSDAAGKTILSPHRIVIDGVALDGVGQQAPPAQRGKPHYYICPRDETMLRVPHSNHSGGFKCPVDGTPMKPAKGRESAIFLLN